MNKPFISKGIYGYIILLSILLSGCRTPVYECSKQVTPITIDGAIKDWDNYPRYALSEFRTSVSMVNDDSTLYVLILRENLDPQIAQGVNLWMTPKKKRNQINIRYYGQKPSSTKTDPETKMPVNSYREKYDLTDNETRMELGGIWDMLLFQSIEENRPTLVSPNGKEGPKAAFSTIPGSVRAYEFSFPLKNSKTSAYSIPFGAGDQFSFGLEFVSLYSMVWGTNMWEYYGNTLVRTYYYSHSPVTTDVYVHHNPQWVKVRLSMTSE